MTSLTFYGGVKEIGGNKILLEDRDTKIFLDFGMNFTQHANYFTEYMPPRKCTCIRDLIKLKLLPDIKGIYREDYCKHMKLKDTKDNSIDGVLVSHAHIDHIGYIHFLRKDIPIHVSKETKAIMELFTQTGAGGFNEYTQINPSFQLIPKKNGDGLKRRDARDGFEERDVRVFTFEKKFRIGDLEVVPYRVDHSLPGAAGFVIYTSEGSLVYTGDLRFHGRHKGWSYNFVQKAAEGKPEIMLSEGTRIRETGTKTEEYVQEQSAKEIKNKKGLAIVNFPIRDTDRLLTFYNTALSNNRKLIIEVRQAILLDLLHNAGVQELPKTDDRNIKIFYPKKSWGLVGRDDFPQEQKEKDYKSWEKTYLSAGNLITTEEISKNQEKYLMFMNYFQLNNLLDIKPKTGSVHIRSICEPFNDDMALDQKRIDNWMKLLGLHPECKIHSSGHASGPDLIKMINSISPKVIFPIHTEYPGMLRKTGIKCRIVKCNKKYVI